MKQAIQFEELEAYYIKALTTDYMLDKGRAYAKAKSKLINTITLDYEECNNNYEFIEILLLKLADWIEDEKLLQNKDLYSIIVERFTFIYCKSFLNGMLANQSQYKRFISNERLASLFYKGG